MIRAFVRTGNSSGSGTDANVYLGIAGREFALSSAEINNFEAGSQYTYVLGAASNVEAPDYNNPVNPQLYTEWLTQHPVYLRMDGSGTASAWEVDKVTVTVHIEGSSDNVAAATYSSPIIDGEDQTIWLDNGYGLQLGLSPTTTPGDSDTAGNS